MMAIKLSSKLTKYYQENTLGRFNAQTAEEVAVIMVGDPVDNIVIKISKLLIETAL